MNGSQWCNQPTLVGFPTDALLWCKEKYIWLMFVYEKKAIFRLVILMKTFPRNVGYIFILKSLPRGEGGFVCLQGTPTLKLNSVLFSHQYKKMRKLILAGKLRRKEGKSIKYMQVFIDDSTCSVHCSLPVLSRQTVIWIVDCVTHISNICDQQIF